MCRYKISSLGCIATTLQIGALVDPTSNTNSTNQIEYLGKTTRASTGTDTHKVSRVQINHTSRRINNT
jgi:hypothetical protein